MEQKTLICIGCPMGCCLEVSMEGEQVLTVKGQSCGKGIDYAVKECAHPTRILTTTVPVKNGAPEVASVKTAGDIPKNKLFDCVRLLKNVKLTAPVHIGDIVMKNIADTGIDIVATTHCLEIK